MSQLLPQKDHNFSVVCLLHFILIYTLRKGAWIRYSDWLRAGRPMGSEFESRKGKKFFSSPRRPDCLWGPPSPIHWVPGALSPAVKRPGLEADHSSPTSAEVNTMWIYISTPTYAFMA
jgi:hypothetical protein